MSLRAACALLSLMGGTLMWVPSWSWGQSVPRPGLLDLPLSARFAGSAESMGAPLQAQLGDALGYNGGYPTEEQ